MPTLTADIATDRADRFLRQFCQHAAAMGSERGHTARMHHDGLGADVTVAAEWTDTQGVVTFAPWGTCTLTAAATALTVRIDALDASALERIRGIVTRDFDRFSSRNPLRMDWRATAATGRRSRLVIAAVGAVVIVVVAVHAGLASAALRSGWSLIALAAIGVALAAKATLVVLAGRRGHRMWLHHKRPPQAD